MANLSDIKKTLANITKSVEKAKGNAQLIALKEAEAIHKKRIFVFGLATGLSKIGKYSKKPTYISVDKFKSKYGGAVKTGSIKPSGKSGKSKFKNGKTRRSMFLKGGYAQLRKLTGRQNSTVDLNFSGNLLSSIQVGDGRGGKVYGFLNDDAIKLSKVLRRKYRKPIFEISKHEESTAVKTMEFEINRIVDNALRT